MSRLVWGEIEKGRYYSGIDRGVVFPHKQDGVAWNGLISVIESDDHSEVFDRYVDGLRVSSQLTVGGFKATIESYSTPDIVFDLMGYTKNLYTAQIKKPFNFSYRTYVGQDEDQSASYQIHLVYNASIKLSDKSYKTLDDTPDVLSLSWDISAKPAKLEGYVASAHFVVDSSLVHDWTLTELEDILYGTTDRNPRMPSVDELLEIFESGVVLRITDHGDGTWTAEGPDEAIQMIDATTFRITWPSAIYINSSTYQISSL